MRYRHVRPYKYQLAATECIETGIRAGFISTRFITLDGSGRLVLLADYCWDGASGPALDTESCMLASLVHDALYQLMRLGLVPLDRRRLADDLYRDLCLAAGMSRFRAWYHHKAVRLFGAKNAKRRQPRRVIEV